MRKPTARWLLALLSRALVTSASHIPVRQCVSIPGQFEPFNYVPFDGTNAKVFGDWVEPNMWPIAAGGDVAVQLALRFKDVPNVMSCMLVVGVYVGRSRRLD